MTAIYVPVAVGILINNNQEILIAKRPPSKHMSGYWEFPGGKLENTETPVQALSRELHEELGIKIDLKHTTFLGRIDCIYPNFIFQGTIFLCAYWQGHIQSLEEQELKWTDFSALGDYRLLPSCQSIISLLRAKTDIRQISVYKS